MLLIIILLICCSIGMITLSLFPMLIESLQTWRVRKEKTLEKQLDKLFYEKSPKQIIRLYFILPPITGIMGFLFFKSPIFIAVGALLGLFIPNLILKIRDARRRQKFNNQLLDAIMILSSSLKGGLSLLQALEVLVEEMPSPMSQEVGLVVRENKMGVTLEDSLRRLSNRMDMEELELVVNSILVARETGGDLTKVFSRLATTIRDRRKLTDSIKTLTLQGRMQGMIMSVLPILFITWVMTFNRHHFDIMLNSQTGRGLLILAAVLQVVGMVLIRKFSTIRV